MANASESASESVFSDYQEQQALAERAVALIGGLYRDQGVITLMYGRPMMHRTVPAIFEEHAYVAQVEGRPFTVRDSFAILEAVAAMKLTPARIDIGKLTIRWLEQDKPELQGFLDDTLADCVNGKAQIRDKPQDVVLYGFGRIGRLVTRLLLERAGNGEGMRLRAVVIRKGGGGTLEKRAELLRRDSVHGAFQGTIEVDEENHAIIANGAMIRFIEAGSPEEIDYTAYGIENALICDNTGAWRDAEGLGRHLKAKGAGKVLLTAPGKGDIKNLVCGVNDGDMRDDDRILSAASCTTNAIVPVLKAVDDKFGIDNGHIETVHSYTNDQNLIDNFHKAERRGRSAPLNMVLTSTGAAKAVAKALPALKGKLTGNAIRVPTPNVSMAILMLNLEQEVTAESLNEHLKWAANRSELHKQIDFSASAEIASTDVVGSRFAGVVDSKATIADGKRAILYIWYDNEFGYSVQVVRILQRMAGINYAFFPKPLQA